MTNFVTQYNDMAFVKGDVHYILLGKIRKENFVLVREVQLIY